MLFVTVKGVIKEIYIFVNYISDFFSKCIDQGEFPSLLKNASQFFRGSLENFCPFSILPVFSKIFEQLLAQQNISVVFGKVTVHSIVF